MDQGLSETANLQKQFNINTYAPTMLVFKENTDKPADIIQVNHSSSSRGKESYYTFLFTHLLYADLFALVFTLVFLCGLSSGQRDEKANH